MKHTAPQPQEKMEFFLAASHQLKTPLAIIQWCLQTALESADLKGKEREMVMKSLDQAGSMNNLVGDMLHVFRLFSRDQDKAKNYERVDLSDMMREIYQECLVRAQHRSVKLQMGPLPAKAAVMADPTYLKQAIINLVDNAIKYSPGDGVVMVTLELHKEQWELAVRDQGIGISEADKERLFTEFFRSTEAREVSHEGTGLGLVLARHVARELGGDITVKSRLHRGSTFTLNLPATATA